MKRGMLCALAVLAVFAMASIVPAQAAPNFGLTPTVAASAATKAEITLDTPAAGIWLPATVAAADTTPASSLAPAAPTTSAAGIQLAATLKCVTLAGQPTVATTTSLTPSYAHQQVAGITETNLVFFSPICPTFNPRHTFTVVSPAIYNRAFVLWDPASVVAGAFLDK